MTIGEKTKSLTFILYPYIVNSATRFFTIHLYSQDHPGCQGVTFQTICILLSLHLHQVVRGTRTLKPSNVLGTQQRGEYLPLGQRTSVVGRAETLPLQILDDGVSRRHCRVLFDKDSGRYYAEDMNSRHGALVNMRRITDKTPLSEGDQIIVGQASLFFTEKDFDTKESALTHYKLVGEKSKTTRIDSGDA